MPEQALYSGHHIGEGLACDVTRELVNTLWTHETARQAPFVQWKQGVSYVGERRLILQGEDTTRIYQRAICTTAPAWATSACTQCSSRHTQICAGQLSNSSWLIKEAGNYTEGHEIEWRKKKAVIVTKPANPK